MKCLALIPAFNEARSLNNIIQATLPYVEHVLVVDDGSCDDTTLIAKKAGALVITHPVNLGKGAACRSGLYAARSMSVDAVITLDSDGQHNPCDIPKLIHAFNHQPDASMVIGNRMNHTKTMPLLRFLTNALLSKLISTLCHCKVPDSQCGFRLLHKKLYQHWDFENNHFDAESEMLVRAARDGHKIISTEIQTIYGNQYSKIRIFKDTFRFLNFYLRHFNHSPPIANSKAREASIAFGQNFNPPRHNP